jgi:RNA polymerase sigma-70 factor (ECF subfamily)
MTSSHTVDRAARGDRDAFDVLVEGSIDRLFGLARLILQDVDLAEDAVQEALVRCWQRLPTLRDPERFDVWLRRLLVNAAIDLHRQRRRHRAMASIVAIDVAIPDPGKAVADRDQLRVAFQRLRIEHRIVLVLHHHLGLSTSEIAVAIGVPGGTARSRLHYATEALRAAVEAGERSSGVGRTSA